MSEDPQTQQFEDFWLPPVEKVENLPATANDGQMCFVKTEGRVYAYQQGAWIAATPPRR